MSKKAKLASVSVEVYCTWSDFAYWVVFLSLIHERPRPLATQCLPPAHWPRLVFIYMNWFTWGNPHVRALISENVESSLRTKAWTPQNMSRSKIVSHSSWIPSPRRDSTAIALQNAPTMAKSIPRDIVRSWGKWRLDHQAIVIFTKSRHTFSWLVTNMVLIFFFWPGKGMLLQPKLLEKFGRKGALLLPSFQPGSTAWCLSFLIISVSSTCGSVLRLQTGPFVSGSRSSHFDDAAVPGVGLH